MGRFPLPPYPRGWYQIALSRDVAQGEIKTVQFFGKELILFRAKDDSIRVSDAHCPHLGAHLGVGGKNENGTLRCPFHGWKFDSEGDCVNIPYCKSIPKNAKLKMYPTAEHSHVVFMYYDENGMAPDFELPAFPEFVSKEWSAPTFLQYDLQSHVQEMAENTLDTGHFPLVHTYFKVPTINKLHIEDQQLLVDFSGERKVFGWTNKMEVELDARGLGVVFGKTVTNFLNIRVIHSATPIDETSIQVNLMYVFKKTWNPLRNTILKLAMPREVFNFTRGDHAILNSKVYRENPRLCPNDGPILKLRRWAKQFYLAPAQLDKEATM